MKTIKPLETIQYNEIDQKVNNENCIHDAGNMPARKLPDLIKYYELDERVNVENYTENAVRIEYDKDIFHDWIDYEGMELVDDGFRYYKEIAESHLKDSRSSDYYRGTWVAKSLYNEVQNLRNGLKIPVSKGTLCMLVIAIRHDFNHIRSSRLGNIYTDERWEFLKFLKALYDIVHSNANATSLEIQSCSKQLIKAKYPKYIAEHILEAFESPSGSNYFPFLLEYVYKRDMYCNYESTPAELKKWFEIARRSTVKQLNNLLLKYDLPKTSRHLAIDQLLAIAGLEYHEVIRAGMFYYGKNRDNISRKIKRLLG